VTLTFDALSGKGLAGRVAVISPTATTSSGVVTYQVRVEVDPAQAQAAGVRSGMTAAGTIVTETRRDVLLAPNRAIKTQSGAKTVQVLDATGTATTRPVQVGLSSDASSEITGGLQPGERVVIPTTSTAAVRLGGPGGIAGAGGPPPGPPPG
jgi:multidrug efflux pump subunit AcrA (membrane-fusion protein)